MADNKSIWETRSGAWKKEGKTKIFTGFSSCFPWTLA